MARRELPEQTCRHVLAVAFNLFWASVLPAAQTAAHLLRRADCLPHPSACLPPLFPRAAPAPFSSCAWQPR